MQIQFKGVTFVKGEPEQVKAYNEKKEAKDVTALTASADWKDSSVILDGQDTDVFFSQEYGLTIPEELKGKTSEEAGALVASDPAKYSPFVQKLMEALSDPFAFIDKMFAYAEAKKAEGQDAEGNPVKEVQL